MDYKTYGIFTFIINNINWSVSSIKYDRFKRERIQARIEEKFARETNNTNCTQEQATKRRKESSSDKGFFDDLLWMLEYNQNGFMQLFIYFIQLILLTSQVITSTLYVSFPTDRDPITHVLINPWLRYAEYLSMVDYLNNSDAKGRYNLLVGLLVSQCLVLRVRAFIARFYEAKVNRYQYKELNIVSFEMAYASEFRFSHKKCFEAAPQLFNHQCKSGYSLSGKFRRETLEFNKRIRVLSKIDRIYYYNQIDFNECFRDVSVLKDYKGLIKKCDDEIFEELETTGNLTDEREKTQGKNIDWFKYLLCFDLPDKISYVSVPESRLDLSSGTLLYFCYLFCTLLVIVLTPAIYLATIYMYSRFQDWKLYSHFHFIFGLLKNNLVITIIVSTLYDSALLSFCSILFLSRSRKVAKLLQNEREFYNNHLKRISDIHLEHQLLAGIKSKYFNLPTISTGFKKRTGLGKEDEVVEVDSCNHLCSRFKGFSFLRKKRTSDPITQTESDRCNQDCLDELIESYREDLDDRKILKFKENFNYLLDLVEVLQFELNDHKRFFTTLLDINVIFGTLGCSVSVAIFVNSTDIFSIYFTVVGFISCLLPMIFSLFVGASSEASVS